MVMARNALDHAIHPVRSTVRSAVAVVAVVHAMIMILSSRVRDRFIAHQSLIDLPIVSFDFVLVFCSILNCLLIVVKIKITTTSDKRIVKDKTYNADLILNNRRLAGGENGKALLVDYLG